MTDAYDPTLRAIAARRPPRRRSGAPLREAIYAGMAGPAYETPAEVRLLRTLGAGLVGMSTVHEVIAARHAGLPCSGCRWSPTPPPASTPVRCATRTSPAPRRGRGRAGAADRRRRRGAAHVITPAQAAARWSRRRAPSARRAHAPYSKFRVGAAVLDERGRIHVGCNVENASYGLTVCAERNAVAAAVAAGAKRIRAVAVVDRRRRPRPCGACRQVLAELGAADRPSPAGAPGRRAPRTTLGALLPNGLAH